MTLRAAALKGAKWGLLLALAYGLVFCLLGSLRYVLDVSAAPPDGGFWTHVMGGAVSLTVAALGITLLMALLAAALGAVTALLAASVDKLWTARSGVAHGAAAGFFTAAGMLVLLHGALWAAGLWSPLSFASTTYLFWLGIPSLIYLAAAAYAGRASQLSSGLPTGALHRGTIA
jgi:hypothetical protein